MRAFTDNFAINDTPLLVPDAGVQFQYVDVEGASSGRDQAGFLHRNVVRSKVPSWTFSYSHLTEEEKNYMESLFGDADSFLFTHPSRTDATVTEQTQCYRSRYGISWQNAISGLWRNYSFTVSAL